MGEGQGLFQELQRRQVWRVAAAYSVMAWLLVQVATQVFPFFDIPNWVVRLVVILLALGFPVAVVLAWIYELTPDGIRRTESLEAVDARSAAATHALGRRLNRIILVLLMLVVLFLGWRVWVTPVVPAAPANAPAAGKSAASGVPAAVPGKSIAVLPFRNLSAEQDNAYFVDGLQDLILTRLAGITDLRVIARTSSSKFSAHAEDLAAIRHQLGVAHILEGSVQKAGNEVLVSVQLIDTETGGHLWAETYQRTLANVFDVEGEVAGEIARTLGAKLSPVESARLAAVPTTNQNAYDLFLRAEYLTRQSDLNFTTAGYKEALPLYRKAIEEDPGFAQAYAQRSYVESSLVWLGSGEDDLSVLATAAQADAERAVALQPELAAAHAALGLSAFLVRQDYAAALDAFAAALKLHPNDALILSSMGYVLRRQGQMQAAIEKFERAVALDPLDASVAQGLGETYSAVARDADAERLFRRVLALAPDDFRPQLSYSQFLLVSQGSVARALDAARGDAPQVQAWRVQLLTLQRRYREALALRQALPAQIDNLDYQNGPKALTLANLQRLLGQQAHARALYAQALPQLQAQVAALAGSPIKLGFVWRNLAEALLGLDRRSEALAALEKSQALALRPDNQFFGPWLLQLDAALYARVGLPERAIPLLTQALATPGSRFFCSPALLWVDPAWDPVREDAGFKALQAKYLRFRPAAIDVTST